MSFYFNIYDEIILAENLQKKKGGDAEWLQSSGRWGRQEGYWQPEKVGRTPGLPTCSVSWALLIPM